MSDRTSSAASVYEHECVECGRVVISLEPPILNKDFICGPHEQPAVSSRATGAGTPGAGESFSAAPTSPEHPAAKPPWHGNWYREWRESAAQDRFDYMNEQAGFWRSLWLVLKGRRLREYVTYRVTDELLPDGDTREVWTRA